MRDFLLDTQTIRYWHDTGCSQHAAVIENIAVLRQSTVSFEVKPKLLMTALEKPIFVIAKGEDYVGLAAVGAPDIGTISAFGTREEAENAARAVAESYGHLPALYRIVQYNFSGKVFEA